MTDPQPQPSRQPFQFPFTAGRDTLRGHVVTLLGYVASGSCSAEGLLAGCNPNGRRIRQAIVQFLITEHYIEAIPLQSGLYRKGQKAIGPDTVDTLAGILYNASREYGRGLQDRYGPPNREAAKARKAAKKAAKAAIRAARSEKALQTVLPPVLQDVQAATSSLQARREAREAASSLVRGGKAALKARKAAKPALAPYKREDDRTIGGLPASAYAGALADAEEAASDPTIGELIARQAAINRARTAKPKAPSPSLQATSDRLRGIAWRLSDSQTPGEVRNLADSLLEVAAELDRHGAV